jgi:hypothetical protein
VTFLDIIDRYYTCEFTTLARDGSPVTWPVSPMLLTDGRFIAGTSIGLPQKASNIRRNPKVSLLFSEPTGSGVAEPGAVLIQGDATAEARIVTDLLSNPELATALIQIKGRLQRRAEGWVFQSTNFDAPSKLALVQFLRSTSASAQKYLDKRGLERPPVKWAAVKEVQRRAKAR